MTSCPSFPLVNPFETKENSKMKKFMTLILMLVLFINMSNGQTKHTTPQTHNAWIEHIKKDKMTGAIESYRLILDATDYLRVSDYKKIHPTLFFDCDSTNAYIMVWVGGFVSNNTDEPGTTQVRYKADTGEVYAETWKDDIEQELVYHLGDIDKDSRWPDRRLVEILFKSPTFIFEITMFGQGQQVVHFPTAGSQKFASSVAKYCPWLTGKINPAISTPPVIRERMTPEDKKFLDEANEKGLDLDTQIAGLRLGNHRSKSDALDVLAEWSNQHFSPTKTDSTP